MLSYVCRRGCYYASIFAAIVLISFSLFHLIPADPARTILGPNASDAQVEQLQKKLGLDLQLPVQFLKYLSKIARLDFGRSHVDGRDIADEILYRLKITLILTGLSSIFIIVYLLIVIALLDSKIRILLDGIDLFISSLPIFFSGIIAAIATIYFYPVVSFSGNLSLNDFLYLIPPAVVLSFYPMAILSSIVKQEYATIKNAPFMITAKALGFSNTIVIFKHFGKNVLFPVLSAYSNILPIYITGTFIIEIIFSIPGLSSVIVKSIMGQDFPMLEATIIINGLFFILINLGFEFLYPMIDPRVIKRGSQ